MNQHNEAGTGIGIEAVGASCGLASVDIAEMFRVRGLDDRRLANLMMQRKSVPLPCEDVVTFAANAAHQVIEPLSEAEKRSIELIVVGTESAVDFARSTGSYLHGLLGLDRTCRLFEVKQACYAGTAALQTACALLAASPRPDARALVIGADVAMPHRGTYLEPSQGAGAVAVLVGRQPRIAAMDMGAYGCHSYDAGDGSRPLSRQDLLDVDLSLLSYLDCLQYAWADYAAVVENADFVDSFHRLTMHTPFPGMVKGAHRSLLRRLGRLPEPEIATDFADRVESSLIYPAQVGNIYAGTVLLALASTIDHTPDEGYRMGVFSYGSGCSSEFTSLVVLPGARAELAKTGIGRALEARTELDVAAYDALIDEALPPDVEDAKLDLAAIDERVQGRLGSGPHAVLTSVKGYRREYAWYGDL
jgi:polyketide biosynthesis 3-hydroxy-3-methylglutaryl-CoA synthase-like enzyme PksG